MRFFNRETYPIGIWEGPRAFVMTNAEEADARYAEMREAGIDVLFLFAELQDPAWLKLTLDAAVKQGVSLIVDLSAVWRDAEKRTAVIAATRDCPAVAAFNVVDEPPRAWFPELRAAVEAIRAEACGKDVFVNLNPSYAPPPYLGEADDAAGSTPYRAYLREFMEMMPVDTLSFDFYPYVGASGNEDVYRLELLRNLTDMKVAANAAGIPFAGFLQSSRWGRYEKVIGCGGEERFEWRGTRIPTDAEYRYLASVHLAFGAEMLTNFLYWSRSGTRPDQRMPGVFDGIMAETGEPNPIRETVCRVSGEIRAVTARIRGWKHEGVMVSGLTAAERGAVSPLTLESFGGVAELSGSGRCLAGCFTDGTRRAVLVVSLCDDGGRSAEEVRLDLTGVYDVTVCRANGTAMDFASDGLTLTLESGEAALVILD